MLAHGSLLAASWLYSELRSAMSRISISALLLAEPAAKATPYPLEKDALSPYTERHGRLYHSRLIHLYPFPCDEAELERWDALHHAHYNVALEGRLHCSTLPTRRLRILDVGCGTGIWAISMAEKYPDAEIIAIDLGSHYPQKNGVDFGVTFVSGIDFTVEGWLSEADGFFDFIHLGLLCGSVPDWTRLFREAYRLLRAGGQIESVEFDWTPYQPALTSHDLSDLALLQHWWRSIDTATSSVGCPLAYPAGMEAYMHEAGLIVSAHKTVNIHNAEDMRLHEDDQPNRLARWHRYTTFHPQFRTIRAISMEPLTTHLGYSEEQAANLCETVNRSLNRPDSPFFHKLHVVSARRD